MSHYANPVSRVRYHAEKSFGDVAPWIPAMARVGYVAKGIVYCLIGLLAVLAAFGNGGETTGSKGALHNLLGKPGGVFLVAILAIGLAGYAVWCFVQAVMDPDRKGKDWKGIALRAGRFFKGIVHLSLVAAAVGMVTGRGSGGDGESNIDRWTAKLMSLPFGIWLVGIAGACVVGYGIYQLVRAWRVDLDKMLDLHELDAKARRPVMNVSRFGIGARGVVFGAIGAGLILAALHANPSEANGVGGALRFIAARPYGPWLLAAVAVGLIAYGVYEFVRARYRVIRAK
jgi:hypothetical protein